MMETITTEQPLSPAEQAAVKEAEEKAAKVEGKKAEPKKDGKKAEPKRDETEAPALFPMFIPSRMVEYREETVGGKKQRFLHGFVNGRPFKVQCDVQVEVDETVFGALQGVREQLSEG